MLLIVSFVNRLTQQRLEKQPANLQVYYAAAKITL
jgi:hypothetical protein